MIGAVAIAVGVANIYQAFYTGGYAIIGLGLLCIAVGFFILRDGNNNEEI